ncbi:CPBP family intramembrane metalloprotease [Lactobacillus sp. YT155]|uniref:CPBP family intramembrane glutamic endopeptidase n=1 Tax=Lactobacillus sp. YT155 TaxID=3060955 RepID=UPI0026602FE1|nr:CPBP family intramembrane glutamic endopeptidase [Lactobacillus sp. YT155]MDO1605008.1 CPBP family intramembrane metalloprotease [Lactobacillus sp. YT155]
MKTLRNILIYIGFFLLFQLPITAMRALMMSGKLPQSQQTIYLIIAGLSMIIAPVGMGLYYKKINHNYQTPLNLNALLMIIAGTVLIIVINLATLPFMKATGNANVDALTEMMQGLPYLMLLYSVIVAPVMEELFFRGLFMNLFFKDSPYWGLVVSSIIFGLLHTAADPIYLISKILLGFILGFVYLKTRNIRANILVHILNNVLAWFY